MQWLRQHVMAERGSADNATTAQLVSSGRSADRGAGVRAVAQARPEQHGQAGTAQARPVRGAGSEAARQSDRMRKRRSR